MTILMFLTLPFFLVSCLYVLSVGLVLPVIIVLSPLFHLLKSSLNVLLNKISVMRFKNYIIEKKFQSACACMKSKKLGISELFVRLVREGSFEYYQTKANSLHKAIDLMYRQIDRNMCDTKCCEGCKHCSISTKTLLFNLKAQTG